MTKSPTSYPYLTVAKAYGVDYWRVLQFAELLDVRPPTSADWGLPHLWMVATCLAYKNEQNRRMMGAAEPAVVMPVRGDCGVIHGSVVEWQDCSVCTSILNRRLAKGGA